MSLYHEAMALLNSVSSLWGNISIDEKAHEDDRCCHKEVVCAYSEGWRVEESPGFVKAGKIRLRTLLCPGSELARRLHKRTQRCHSAVL